MNPDALELRKLFDEAGIGWAKTSDLNRILSEIEAVEAEHERRYGSRPALLQRCRADPGGMASFLQSLMVPMTSIMRAMIVQVLHGATVEAVQYRYQLRQQCSVIVQLSHPSRDFGEADRFESTSLWDTEIFRHFALMEVDNEPILDGYYAFRSPHDRPWETQAQETLERTLEATTWNVASRHVVVPNSNQKQPLVVSDLEAFREHLEHIYRDAWYAKVPFDSGIAAFEPSAIEAVHQALEQYEDNLTSLGWRL